MMNRNLEELSKQMVVDKLEAQKKAQMQQNASRALEILKGISSYTNNHNSSSCSIGRVVQIVEDD